MTTEATIARENAIPLEVKKDGLQQRQDGSWLLRLRVHPQDSMKHIADAPMGQRYMLAMVALGDNDEPKQRKTWAEMTPAAQAGVRCNEPEFWTFLNVHNKAEAEIEVRKRCGVQSRTEFSADERAAAAWETLDADFIAYQRGMR